MRKFPRRLRETSARLGRASPDAFSGAALIRIDVEGDHRRSAGLSQTAGEVKAGFSETKKPNRRVPFTHDCVL
jgi:hypothetical protein